MIRYIQEIILGKRAITARMRYEIARVGVWFIHTVLLILFICIRCTPLAIFNCFSILFYAVIAEILIVKEKYEVTFASAYLEIILHSLFACMVMGWGFGFELYNIGLIYIAFYFSYISTNIQKKILVPAILGSISLALTLVMRLYAYFHSPVYTGESESFALFLSCMNITVSAVMIMFFAALHSIEIRRKEYELLTINAELDEIAHFDALTKLRNRRSMEQELHAILDRNEGEHCFIMGDIDDFKLFNDTYGHACGDYVLKMVASIFLKNMEEKHIACRWGGEEILILVNGNMEYSRIIAEKIRYEIDHMNSVYQNQPLHITMTFGIAPCVFNQSFEKCIRMADTRLYKGKQAGKNCIVSE